MEPVNTDRFTGFAALYDAVRPQPPPKVCEIVLQLLGLSRLCSVVDLGAGTGLSTQIWTTLADQLIGIEPTPDMIKTARLLHPELNFLQATSYATTLPSQTADLVVCSQSFHWMEPVATLREIERILKPIGLFVSYDCQWPVSWYWPAEQAYDRLIRTAQEVAASIPPLAQAPARYPKEKHLEHLRDSGIFAYCGTVLFDHLEHCDAERFVGIALSQGHVQDVLKAAPASLDRAIQELKSTAQAGRSSVMRVSYTLHYGIRQEIGLR